MANTFLHATGLDIGKSLAEKDLADTALRIIERARETGCAIILPVDGVCAYEFKAGAQHHTYGIDAIPADQMILDVGSQSVERINAAINDAATLVWNGPLGAFEIAPFDQGTVAAARHAAERTQGRQARLGGRRRRYGRGAQPCRRRRRLHLCLDGGRRLPGMARRQGSAGRRGVARLKRREAKSRPIRGLDIFADPPQESRNGGNHGPHHASTASRSRRRARLRRAGVQHQQHGAGPRHHGGGERRSTRRSSSRRAAARALRQRHHAGADDRRARRDLPAYSGLHASRPRQQPVDLPHRDPVRLHLGDDGRLAQGGRQDAGATTTTTSTSPARSSIWPIAAASRSRASLACSVRSRPARARRRTATAPRGSSRRTSF